MQHDPYVIALGFIILLMMILFPTFFFIVIFLWGFSWFFVRVFI
jgi:hypothetical protein